MSVIEVSSRIQARALQLDPVKVLLFLLLSPFYLVGIVGRVLWVVVAFALAAAADGWQTADTELRKRQSEPRR